MDQWRIQTSSGNLFNSQSGSICLFDDYKKTPMFMSVGRSNTNNGYYVMLEA